MKLVLRVVCTFAWALWFGGMLALLIFVTRLFGASRATGVAGAPVLFDTFGVYQIVLGAVAVIAASLMWMTSRGPRKAIAVATCTLLVALVLAFPIVWWTRQIDSLRVAGQTQTDQFRSLHRQSSIAYVASAAALLVAGVALVTSTSGRAPSPTCP
jgi:hypothetical protein